MKFHLKVRSKPSIKLIAFVIPTIQITVTIIAAISSVTNVSKNGRDILLICMPQMATTMAASICPVSFTNGLIPFKSSTKQNTPRITIPEKKPINFR